MSLSVHASPAATCALLAGSAGCSRLVLESDERIASCYVRSAGSADCSRLVLETDERSNSSSCYVRSAGSLCWLLALGARDRRAE